MIVGLILAGVIVYYVRKYQNRLDFDFFESRLFYRILLFAILALIIFGYLIPKVFYFPYANGILGDIYNHLWTSWEVKHYVHRHHTIFPLISEYFIEFMVNLGLLDINDPQYYEKYFALSIIPVSVISVVSLLAFSLVLARKSKSNLSFYLVFLLVGTGFGFWIYAIQSYSKSLAFCLQLITCIVFILWYEKPGFFRLLILILLICAGPWTHISLFYWSVGSFISLGLLVVLQDYSTSRKTIEITICFLITIAASYVFYRFEAILNGMPDVRDLARLMADTDFFGGFSGQENIFKSLGKNLDIGIHHMTSFPGRVSFDGVPDFKFHQFFIFRSKFTSLPHHTFFYAILIYSGMVIYENRKRINKGILYSSLIISVLTLIGFMIRQAGQHYYVIALIPNLCIFLSVFTLKDLPRNQKSILAGLSILVIVIATSMNVFSRSNVFRGSDIMSKKIYRDSRILADATAKTDSVAFFEKEFIRFYPYEAIMNYYSQKFGRITWVQPPEGVDWDEAGPLLDSIQTYQGRNYQIFVGNRGYQTLQNKLIFSNVSGSIWKLDMNASKE